MICWRFLNFNAMVAHQILKFTLFMFSDIIIEMFIKFTFRAIFMEIMLG